MQFYTIATLLLIDHKSQLCTVLSGAPLGIVVLKLYDCTVRWHIRMLVANASV